MEIVLLVVLWIIAAFAAELHNISFALFLVFASMAVIAWRWRGKLDELRRHTDLQEQLTASLRSELSQLAQELKLLRSQLVAPATKIPTVADKPDVKATPMPSVSTASAVPRAVVPETKPTAAATPPATVPASSSVTAQPLPENQPIQKPQPVAPSVPAPPVIAASSEKTVATLAEAHSLAAPITHADKPAAPIAARTTVAPPPAFRIESSTPASAAAKPPQKLKKALDLEELVGRNVLPKIGIFFLVLGMVGWIATQWQHIPAIGKDLLLLAAAGALLVPGIFLERREKYEVFGRVLIGGGWSMLFFTSYALYHVSATRILPEQWTDLVIMLATAAVMVWHTLKYRSQLVTGIAYLLAFSTVTISQDTVFSLSAGVVLALSLVVLVHRMRWYELEVFGILASYLNHFRFLFPILGMGNVQHRMFPEFYWSSALLIFYWAVFRGSYIVRRIESKHEEDVSTIAGLLNPFLLLGLMKYQSFNPQLAFYALLALGALEFILGQLPITRRRRLAFLILTTLGSTLMIAAVPFKFSGMNTAVLWLAGAEALLIAGVQAREVAFRRLGMIAGLLTSIHILVVDIWPWFSHMVETQAAVQDFSLGVLVAFCAAVLFADAHLIELRWRDLFGARWDRWLLSTLSYAAGLIATAAIWVMLPQLLVAVGWAALMLVFAICGKRLSRTDLTMQAPVLALGTGMRVFMFNLQANGTQLAHGRLWTVALVAILFYSAARFTEVPQIEVGLRAFFQWSATAMVAALVWAELPQHWVAAAWTGFAVVLTLVARRLKLQSLLYQCYALSAAALVMSVSINWPLEMTAGHILLRLITVSLVAAGLYLLALIAQPFDSQKRTICRIAFNTGAAFLLGGLIWYEAGELWAPVFWTAFATALLLAWRRFDFAEFFVHGNALAFIALIGAYASNMFSDARIHGWSARLVTVALISAMFYFCAWLATKYKREDWPVQIGDFYSWGASLLATTLMWHELRPIDVALAWAIFGIVLFEIGLERKLGALRWQGGVALVASFTRIFFVNLNAVAEPGHISPRVYSIVPLALVYLYVYWRTLAREEAFGPSRWRQIAPMLFSSLSVASIAFLMRFEAPAPYVVVFWAALVLLLLAVARWLGQAVFLYQAIVLGVCTTVRAMMYNLETPSYFSATDVRARTVGAVIGLFLVALVFAFPLRNSPPADLLTGGSALRGWLRRSASRPEQLFFFAAVALLTPLIAVEMARGEITIGWGVEAVIVFVFALIVSERSFRLCGLGLLLLCLGKLLVDVWNMNTGDRTISMTVLGAVLLLVSFLYNRYREAIRKYL